MWQIYNLRKEVFLWLKINYSVVKTSEDIDFTLSKILQYYGRKTTMITLDQKLLDLYQKYCQGVFEIGQIQEEMMMLPAKTGV